MPDINGWEFLEEYEKQDTELKGEIIILLLTTSLMSDDEQLANSFASVQVIKTSH